MSADIGIVFHSMYGHTHELAEQIAAGVEQGEGKPQLRRVPELMSEGQLAEAGAAEAQDALSTVPLATVDELADFDGIIFGSPTRFGNRTSQLSSFLDQTGPLWASGALVGKTAGFFTGAATMHGGFESTILTMSTFAYHHGMLIVPMGYSDDAASKTRSGGGPYGPSHWSPQGEEKEGLTAHEISIANSYGRFFAEVTGKLAA